MVGGLSSCEAETRRRVVGGGDGACGEGACGEGVTVGIPACDN